MDSLVNKRIVAAKKVKDIHGKTTQLRSMGQLKEVGITVEA